MVAIRTGGMIDGVQSDRGRGGIRGEISRGRWSLVRVRVIEKVARNHQLKVQHLGETHAGMEEFVSQRQVVVRWNETKAFPRDEQRLQAVFARSADCWDRVTGDAVQLIFESSGETDINVYSVGRVTGGSAAIR